MYVPGWVALMGESDPPGTSPRLQQGWHHGGGANAPKDFKKGNIF